MHRDKFSKAGDIINGIICMGSTQTRGLFQLYLFGLILPPISTWPMLALHKSLTSRIYTRIVDVPCNDQFQRQMRTTSLGPDTAVSSTLWPSKSSVRRSGEDFTRAVIIALNQPRCHPAILIYIHLGHEHEPETVLSQFPPG